MARFFRFRPVMGKDAVEQDDIRPRIRAAIVPTSPIPSLTMSLESALRCCGGRAERRRTPARAPPKTHANTIKLTVMELMIKPPTRHRLSATYCPGYVAAEDEVPRHRRGHAPHDR